MNKKQEKNDKMVILIGVEVEKRKWNQFRNTTTKLYMGFESIFATQVNSSSLDYVY